MTPNIKGQDLLQALVDNAYASLGKAEDTSDVDKELRLAIQNLGRRQAGEEERSMSELVGLGLGDQPHLLQRSRQNVRLQSARAAGDLEAQALIKRAALVRAQRQANFGNAANLYAIMKSPEAKGGFFASPFASFLGGIGSGLAAGGANRNTFT